MERHECTRYAGVSIEEILRLRQILSIGDEPYLHFWHVVGTGPAPVATNRHTHTRARAPYTHARTHTRTHARTDTHTQT